MPKPGYTTIVVKESVRSRLHELVASKGYRTINQLLEDIIYRVYLGVYPKKAQKTNLWWTGGDLNPRPPPCEGGIHSRLNYRPFEVLRLISSKNLN